MGKTAFLFSGQGAQRAGMGKEFYEHFASVRALFDAAEELRPGTLQQMFAGSDDELRQTENTQPCLYLADLAAAYALRDSGLQPEAVAGFSLGEIPALAFAGAYDGMTGFRLACARGASMARAGKNVNASMAAIVKLPDETVERLCAAYDHVWPVNYNCDGQIAVSGDRDELERLYADVAAAGGRSMPLNVSGGFHSPYMDPASAEFGAILADTALQKPALPAYANRTAEPYGENVRELLLNFREKIHKEDFKTALLTVTRRFEAQSGVSAKVQFSGNGPNLTEKQKLQVTFIIQEALSNIRKHAKASQVEVRIMNNRDFVASVRDNGVGIDRKLAEERKARHVGLSIMEERAKKIGAELVIDSEPGKGTTVEVRLPEENRKND